MNLIIDLNALITILVGGGIAGGIKLIHDSLKEIRNDAKEIKTSLGKLNGRVGRCETWAMQHEKIDDERHEAATVNIENLRESVNTQVNTLLGWKKP